jgi:RHS repeat-associated protein
LSRLVSGITYGNTLTESTTWTLDYEQSRCVLQDGPTVHVDATLTRADGLNITGIADAVTPANLQSLGYSAPNRLTSATGPWGALAWSFDGVGNRTAETATPPGGSAATDVYAYPATSNRLMSVTRGAQTVRALTYDNAGNILSDNRLGTPTAYTYNARNRLTSATSGALVWGYSYNAREQLVSRTLDSGGDLTHFVHDIFGNVIAETNGTGPAGTTREYIWLPETEIAPTSGSRAQIDRPLGVVSGVGGPSPQLWMVHVDHLNHPSRMTDAGKAVVWNAVWLPWGGVHAITGAASLDARLPGQWYQLETGLHYNWHRHYDPTLGRYTQPDPLGFVDGPGVYAYAGGSPHMAVDPTGEFIPALGLFCLRHPHVCRAIAGAA